jgi:hypothetical protein
MLGSYLRSIAKSLLGQRIVLYVHVSGLDFTANSLVPASTTLIWISSGHVEYFVFVSTETHFACHANTGKYETSQFGLQQQPKNMVVLALIQCLCLCLGNHLSLVFELVVAPLISVYKLHNLTSKFRASLQSMWDPFQRVTEYFHNLPFFVFRKYQTL